MTGGSCGKTVARSRHVIAGVCRAGGEVERKRHLSTPPPPSSYRVRGESPPRARCPRNMTDKPAAGGRRRRPRIPDAWRSDAGAPNMCGVRKNGTRIRRPSGVTGKKPSQVCGQSARRDGWADGRAGGRPTCEKRDAGMSGHGWPGNGEGKWKKITRRNTRPPTGRVRADVANESRRRRRRRRSCASRVSPAATPARLSVPLVHDNNNILRTADEILYYHCCYYYYSAGVSTLPVRDFSPESYLLRTTSPTFVRRCEACVVSCDTADNQ